MALTNAFFKDVRNGNVRGVRIMMKDSLLIDPSFAEFREMEKEAQSLEGLYDEHDGRELKFDKAEWNDGYMNRLMVQVLGNFSHERLNHLKEVVRYLRPVATQETEQEIPVKTSLESVCEEDVAPAEDYQEQTVLIDSKEDRVAKKPIVVNSSAYVPQRKISYEEQKRMDQENGVYLGKRVAAGAVAGAAVGAVTAVLIETPLICGIVIGAVGGAAGSIVADIVSKSEK